MKKSLLITILLAIATGLFVNPSVKAFDNPHGKGGRCTGSAYCTACSNCSRCAHCSSGGTCGVCDRGSSKSITYTPKKRNKHSAKKSYPTQNRSSASTDQSFPNSTDQNSTNDILIVKKDVVNIRKSTSTSSLIIEKAYKNARLIKLQTLNTWYKVKVEKTGTIGYVYTKDLK